MELTSIKENEAAVKPTVLLVDDRAENLESLEAILENGHITLLKATSGEQALQLLLENDISLVLLDVQMPGMNGYEVARLMRSNRKTRSVPIIFITAIMRDEAASVRGYQAGAIDYIVKPISSSILRGKVSLLLEFDQNKRHLQHAYAKLDNAKAYYESILNAAGEGVLGISQDGTINFANPAALTLLHGGPGIVGKNFADFYPALEDGGHKWESTPIYRCWQESKECRVDDDVFLANDGKGIAVSYCCSPVSGRMRGIVLVFQDISDRKTLEHQLRQQAITDPLTGLQNRTGFKEGFHLSLERAKRSGKTIALMFVDLDYFKRINDTLGHDVGDHLLQAAADRLKECVRPYDLVSRIGGDEFLVMLDELDGIKDVTMIADKLLAALRRPFHLKNGMELGIGASIGISSYPECGHEAENLIQAADVAMYQAKRNGRNLYQFYIPDMNTKARTRLMLDQALRVAVEHDEFELYYQPQVSLADGEVIGFEALMRWDPGSEDSIAPSIFVPMLEETGLIVPMGSWVFSSSCRQRQQWRDLLPDRCTVAVNLSPRQFSDKNLIRDIRKVLEENEMPSYRLEIELTESMLMLDTDHARQVLHELKDMGVKLSIDDFGTGYSSLAYLKLFTLDTLKIDKHFIDHLTTSKKDAAIATSIIQLAHNLDLQVIAEGVETVEQLRVLQDLECDVVQGFYFGRPISTVDVEKFPRMLALH
ncbi:MAG TPA: EAL domain-containing protein [Burkholderiaceae bacterium]|nr:EAL domain-containing protein [Burkholderiaceae bacterium]